MADRHVLGISGGKDSAALAVYIKSSHPEIVMDYFFCDTGKELPEIYDYLERLENFLGKPIVRLSAVKDFDFWFREFNYYLPSPKARWCTRKLKVEPFRLWAQPWLNRGDNIYNYIAIRADETRRLAPIPHHKNMHNVMPFIKCGIDNASILEILQSSGLAIPNYYDWRSQSGCSFCFFQTKAEWVRLKERHPVLFEEAKAYEAKARENGSMLTWSRGETLSELEEANRSAKILLDYKVRAQKKSEHKINPLSFTDDDLDTYQDDTPCLICRL